MDLSPTSGRSNLISAIKTPKAVVGLLLLLMLVIVVNLVGQKARSKDQITYENWLAVAAVQLRHEKDLKMLPALTLQIIGDGDKVKTREMNLAPSFDVDSRERVVRILELVREADLFARRRPEGSEPQPGDLVLRITTPQNSFSLIVAPNAINGNVKAGLLLKLFDEFSKIPVTTMARMSDKATEEEIADAAEPHSMNSEEPILNDSLLPPDEYIVDDEAKK